MTAPVGAAPQPVETQAMVTDVVVREFVRGLIRHAERYAGRIVLLDGRYDPASLPEFVVDGTPVRVVDCPSVLAAMQASQEHRFADGVLVVLTPRDEHDLGVDLCAQAVKHHRLPVHRWEIVLRRFGARDLDPRLRRLRWVADGLLETEPAQGWPKLPGTVLDHDTALRHLTRRRLGIAADALDATELLTTDPTRLAGLDRLRPVERDGLAAWLIQSIGPAAQILLRLAHAGQGTNALAFGLVAGVLWDARPTDVALARLQGRAQGRAEALLGTAVDTSQVLAFAEATHGVLTRWLTRVGGHTPADAEHRHRLEEILRHADRLLTEFGAEDLADRSQLLDTGLRSRLRTLAAAIDTVLDTTPAPSAGSAPATAGNRTTDPLATMESALDRVLAHGLVPLRAEQTTPATMAVRLVRWLAQPLSEPATVAAGVTGQIREWGWVDRALAAVWAGEPTADPATTAVYARVHDAARVVRDRLDAAFAARLAAWAPGSAAPAELLLVEHVLDRVALPLAAGEAVPPLVLVVDGMSAAVAAQLAEQIRAAGLTELTRGGQGRLAALTTFPSVTAAGRTSLLCGRLATGTADTERSGFRGFWHGHRLAAALFHKADLPGGTGQRLAPAVLDALSRTEGAERTVVGVVLNTVDEALDHGREGGRVDWHLADIRFLPELLAAARNHGRPLLLVSDHGHVLERERGAPSGEDASAARWRPANTPPGPGEIQLTGDRVLLGDGRVVAPWQETIRYTARKAGYHGGASLAEMVAPVLVFVPPDVRQPEHWQPLAPERVTPPWWFPAAGTGDDPARLAPPPAPRTRTRQVPQGEALFDLPESRPPAPDTLGSRVVASATYRDQRRYVRKPPAEPLVVSIIDTLVRSGDRLSTVALAELAGTQSTRIPGLVAVLRSLLNVEGYPVLTLIDGGRTLELNRTMLESQFNLGSETGGA